MIYDDEREEIIILLVHMIMHGQSTKAN